MSHTPLPADQQKRVNQLVRERARADTARAEGRDWAKGVLLTLLTVDTTPTGTASSQWGGVLARAAEHVVIEIDAANAATPHEVFKTGTPVTAAFGAFLEDRVRRLLGRLPLLEVTAGGPNLAIPTFEVEPTAGKQ